MAFKVTVDYAKLSVIIDTDSLEPVSTFQNLQSLVTFTNIDGTSTNYVRCTLNGEVTNSIPQATQFWDGTVHLHTSTPSTFKYLETTISEEEFVLHHYPTYNTTDPTPNPDGKFGKFAVANGQINLKRWDPNFTPSYYWKVIDLTNAINYVPPSANDSFRYHITSDFDRIRMVNCDLVKKVVLDCENDATFGYSDSIDDLSIEYCDLLDEVSVNVAPNGIPARYSRARVVGMNGLTVCNLAGIKPTASANGYAYTTIKNNPNLDTLTIGGSDSLILEVSDYSGNNLSSIVVSNGKRWDSAAAGNQIFRNNNFTPVFQKHF